MALIWSDPLLPSGSFVFANMPYNTLTNYTNVTNGSAFYWTTTEARTVLTDGDKLGYNGFSSPVPAADIVGIRFNWEGFCTPLGGSETVHTILGAAYNGPSTVAVYTNGFKYSTYTPQSYDTTPAALGLSTANLQEILDGTTNYGFLIYPRWDDVPTNFYTFTKLLSMQFQFDESALGGANSALMLGAF